MSAVVGGQVKLYAGGSSPVGSEPFKAPWNPDFNRALAYLRWLPAPKTIFGGTYVQGTLYAPVLEGYASYHFEAPDDCYISYTSAPATWALEDGSMPPAKKPFAEPTFDVATRTFRGTVHWEVPFGGHSRWEYEMVFAEDFESVVGGRMKPYRSDGTPDDAFSFVDPCSLEMRGMSDMRELFYVRKPSVLEAGSRARRSLLDDSNR
eukprot:TRINITY_DN32909_c0_g2_i4.p1 TRINITY_DN32909_c0_g2~~TRINITY_DN32909_c0_g2_i4.p1  ORF type:complete len:206 (-),score=27.11 TRINITY_DN32909_c0_g2_i4:413-1030(-)